MSTEAPTKINVTRTDLNPCTIQLDVVCTAAQVESGFTKALKVIAKKVRVPGFRPGHAPAKMVEKMIDPQALLEQAADEIVRDTFSKAIEQESLKADGRPSVSITKFEKEPPACEYRVKVPLAPQVELVDYKGVPVTKSVATVSDEEVDRQIDELRKRGGKKQEVKDRGIEEGDVAVVNIRAEGTEGDGRNFMVIAGQTFASLDKAISGMRAEEIKSAKLEFPASFQEKDWAGKELETTLTIRSVSAVAMPELDDTFAQSLNATDLGDLKTKVKEAIRRAKDEVSQEMVNEQLLDHLLHQSKVFVADNTWEDVANRRLNEMHQELVNKGSNLEEHAKANGMTLEQLVEAQKQEAKLHVERAVIIERVFTKEGMKITNEDLDAHFLEVARENNIPNEALAKFASEYGAQIRDEIVFRSMYGKVMGFLAEHAKITEVAEGDTPAKPAGTKATKAKSKK
ncbi:MAG: trigger factor [Fimbriimonadaceae bacterium]|nr:trigger factor [Fimbriimonadaceae bacterium]